MSEVHQSLPPDTKTQTSLPPTTVVVPPNTTLGVVLDSGGRVVSSVSGMSGDQLTRVFAFLLLITIIGGGGYSMWHFFDVEREDKAQLRINYESEMEKNRQWMSEEMEKNRKDMNVRAREHNKVILALSDSVGKLTITLTHVSESVEVIRRYLKIPRPDQDQVGPPSPFPFPE